MNTAPPYAEQLDGETYFRVGPGPAHERLCDRLEEALTRALPPNSTWKALPRRSAIRLGSTTEVRPDLALVRCDPNGDGPARPVLFIEVLVPGDHHPETVIKKGLYQHARLPALWLVDPRYLNVEIYRTGAHGFRLEGILANHEALTDPHLPGLEITMHTLFAGL